MPKFQKRHYVTIADALHRAKPKGRPASDWRNACLSISTMLADDNENFQSDRFAIACEDGINAKGVGAGIQGGPAMPYFQGNTPMTTAAARAGARAHNAIRRNRL